MIEKKACALRPLTEADLNRVRGWRNSDRIRSNMYTDHVISEEEHRRWFDRIKDSAVDFYYIVERDRRPVGVVYFNQVDAAAGTCTWGFYRGEPDVPKGTGTMMGVLALDHAFGALGLKVVQAETFAFNVVALDYQRRLGFVETGKTSQARRAAKDEEVIHFELTRDAWLGRRASVIEGLARMEKTADHGIGSH